MASPDHAAILRAFLDNCVPGLTTPDVADAQDALDTLVAALAQARQERDELSWKLNKDSQWFELLATRERAERAERQRDQATQALRELMDALSINDVRPLLKWPDQVAWVTAVEVLANIEKDTA